MAVKTEGLNHTLDQIGSLYIGLIRDDNYVDLGAAGDTLASHGNWEEADEYAGNRKAMTVVSAAGGAITNSASPAEFTMDDTETIKGFFVCTVATGTGGTLIGTVLFTGGDVALVDGSVLTVTATLTLTAA